MKNKSQDLNNAELKFRILSTTFMVANEKMPGGPTESLYVVAKLISYLITTISKAGGDKEELLANFQEQLKTQLAEAEKDFSEFDTKKDKDKENNKKRRFFSLKGLFCSLFAVAALAFSSCEKEVSLSRMELLYNESQGLPQVSIDSIKSFTAKFDNYVGSNPESKQDELYVPTVDNIRYAASLHGYKLVDLTISITINDEWEGETFIEF